MYLPVYLHTLGPLQNVNREMKIKAHNGTEYYLLDVIAQILKYLKSEMLNDLNRSGLGLEATDFDWVITVPTFWRERSKQMMREAGYKARSNIQSQISEIKPTFCSAF